MGDASLVLGIAVGLLCLVPQWAWVTWLARSALPLRRDVESSRSRWVAWAFGMASIALSIFGLYRMHRALIASGLDPHVPYVSEAWIAHHALVAIVVIWVAKRREASRGPRQRA